MAVCKRRRFIFPCGDRYCCCCLPPPPSLCLWMTLLTTPFKIDSSTRQSVSQFTCVDSFINEERQESSSCVSLGHDHQGLSFSKLVSQHLLQSPPHPSIQVIPVWLCGSSFPTQIHYYATTATVSMLKRKRRSSLSISPFVPSVSSFCC